MENTQSSSPQQEHQNKNAALIPQSNNEQTKYSCEICMEPMDNLFSNSSKCAHSFCIQCVIKYIRAKLEEYIFEIRCPALNCKEFLDPLIFQHYISPKLFVRWLDVLCETALMNCTKIYCPNKKCSALILDECKEKSKKVYCPDCKHPFCFKCKIPWHYFFDCKDIESREDLNERAFRMLANKKKWKRCPRCGHFAELVSGCSQVICRCGAHFCYKCGTRSWGCRCNSAHPDDIFHTFLFSLMALVVLLGVMWHSHSNRETPKSTNEVSIFNPSG